MLSLKHTPPFCAQFRKNPVIIFQVNTPPRQFHIPLAFCNSVSNLVRSFIYAWRATIVELSAWSELFASSFSFIPEKRLVRRHSNRTTSLGLKLEGNIWHKTPWSHSACPRVWHQLQGGMERPVGKFSSGSHRLSVIPKTSFQNGTAGTVIHTTVCDMALIILWR